MAVCPRESRFVLSLRPSRNSTAPLARQSTLPLARAAIIDPAPSSRDYLAGRPTRWTPVRALGFSVDRREELV